MGPTACFDKSFLQSLSVDESVWFDQYFSAVITPLFFVETLADLEKQVKAGRSPEDEVGNIANKTPEQSGSPNVFHGTLCNAELRGYQVPMNQKPVLGGGMPAVAGTKKGVVFEVAPEARALDRWRRREFLAVERLHARAWREMLASPPDDAGAAFLRDGMAEVDDCRTLADVLALSRSIVDGPATPYDRMKFVFDVVPVLTDRDRIYSRYRAAGAPSLRRIAPYTAHVLDVEVFCRLAIKKTLIAAERPSNRVDVAYLNYLPFCAVFISGDGLHRRAAPLFMNSSQDFVWGPELKADLKKINELHSSVPEVVRERGIHAFAPYPPKDGDFLTARLWDRMNDRWRNPMKLELDQDKLQAHVVAMLAKLRASTNSGEPRPAIDLEAADALVIDRNVRIKKGSWYQVPKDLMR